MEVGSLLNGNYHTHDDLLPERSMTEERHSMPELPDDVEHDPDLAAQGSQ